MTCSKIKEPEYLLGTYLQSILGVSDSDDACRMNRVTVISESDAVRALLCSELPLPFGV